MSIMVTEVYEALVSAGADEDKAKAAAAAILVGERIATKQDIAVLKFAVFTFGPVIIGLLIKLVFFP